MRKREREKEMDLQPYLRHGVNLTITMFGSTQQHLTVNIHTVHISCIRCLFLEVY